MSSRASLGGTSTDAAAIDANTRAESNIHYLPVPPVWREPNLRLLQSASLFIPAGPPLERGKFTQAAIDVLTVLVGLVLSSLIGAAILITVGGPLLALVWMFLFH